MGKEALSGNQEVKRDFINHGLRFAFFSLQVFQKHYTRAVGKAIAAIGQFSLLWILFKTAMRLLSHYLFITCRVTCHVELLPGSSACHHQSVGNIRHILLLHLMAYGYLYLNK